MKKVKPKAKASKKSSSGYEKMPVINPHAAGIDIGSSFHVVAVGQKEEDVKTFGVYTEDLKKLCSWLKEKGVTSVAMESTGNYWTDLYCMLEAENLNPILVNGRYTKNVSGRKTDVQDSQWIQQMHSLGLLPASFIPDAFTASLRQVNRIRENLINSRSRYINHMGQAMRKMNIRLDVVLRDIVGKTGLLIIAAILAGERDRGKLLSLVDPRCAKKDEFAKALEGTWKDIDLFELKMAYEQYEIYGEKIKECDEMMEKIMTDYLKEETEVHGVQHPELEKKKSAKKENKNAASFDYKSRCYQILGGVDLTEIPGVSTTTLLAFISEVGLSIYKFKSAGQFASWLGVTPNVKISGGKILSSRTAHKKHNFGNALIRSANSIGNGKNGTLVSSFKRIQQKTGCRMKAVVAIARKLAIIIWNMVTKREPFNYISNEVSIEIAKQKTIKKMQKNLEKYGITAEDLLLKTA